MGTKRPLTQETVQAAIDGDPDAIDAVLGYYADDIDALCTRTGRKKNGQIVTHIDEDMRSQIRRMFLRDLPKWKFDGGKLCRPE